MAQSLSPGRTCVCSQVAFPSPYPTPGSNSLSPPTPNQWRPVSSNCWSISWEMEAQVMLCERATSLPGLSLLISKMTRCV